MPLPKIILHAGYPKSASTALQRTASESRELLRAKGVTYPMSFCVNDSKHEDLFRFVRLGKVKKAISLLRNELAASESEVLFLSTESIVNQLNNLDDSQWVELFNGLKDVGYLELVVVVRAPTEFLKSYYKQAVVNQPSLAMDFYATPLTLDKFSKLPLVQRLLDYQVVIEKLERLSGSSVKVFEYGANVVADVLTWVIGEPLGVEVQRSNESLLPEEVELIRQINSFGLSSDHRNAWLKVITQCCSLNSRTALTLAGRANDDDILALDSDCMHNICFGQNSKLGVSDEKMEKLVNDVRHWLVAYQYAREVGGGYSDSDRASTSLKKYDSGELVRCVQNKLLQLTNNASNKALGKKVCINQQLELAPFEAIPFFGWGNWEQDPLNNRSWQWRLNWLSFLSYLMAYHRDIDEDAVLDSARAAIQSWLDAYLETDTSYPFEFIWHDHATALRAEQLLLFAYYCREHAPEWASKHDEFLAYLDQALVVHGQWLAKDSFYSEHTNHGLEQARVLLLLGTAFEGEQAHEWQQISIQRISSELNFAFTDEGVHVENSPAYHIFVFKVFIGIIKDYPDEVLGDLAEQFNQFSAKALSFITHILRPDGKLPPIGDTEQLPTSDAYKGMFSHTLEYKYFLYALTQGKQGIVPPTLNRVYAQSGYAVFRDQWPGRVHYRNAFHLVAKVGCSSRYHHQQDEGHVSLYAGGEDWLIDSGLYNYINSDPVRKYMRGRAGHNVPLISDTSYDPDFEHRLQAWQVEDFCESDISPSILMTLKVMRPVTHRRCIEFDAVNKTVEVRDEIGAEDKRKRNITLQWHFPKDKTMTIDGHNVIITSPTGNRLKLEFDGAQPDSLSVARGQKEGKVFSCISYKANKVEPSQVLRVLFKKKLALNVVSRFQFELAEGSRLPMGGKNPVRKSFDQIFNSGTAEVSGKRVLMLGSSPKVLELAKVFRSAGKGHITLLLDNQEAVRSLQRLLSEQYLTTWVNCKPAAETLKSGAPFEVLLISQAGFAREELLHTLRNSLRPLLRQMAQGGQLWTSDQLPKPLRSLCRAWAEQEGRDIGFVSDLDDGSGFSQQ